MNEQQGKRRGRDAGDTACLAQGLGTGFRQALPDLMG
jgi:hypothetical protein